MKSTKLEIQIGSDEFWWGGCVKDGQSMPYGKEAFQFDLSLHLKGNQGCPLLLSNNGRYVWSEEPFAFSVQDGKMVVESQDGELILSEGHGSLRDAYLHASKTFFPSTGELPGELLFTAPQYNLWIELLYEPTQEKVLQYARDLLANGMPPGVLMIDDNWHEPYGTWEFHSGRFPNPKAMVDELHAMGFQVMLWVCPFITPDSLTFRQLLNTDYLLKDASGKIAIRHWWNGYSAVLDCTNPDAVKWLFKQFDKLQQDFGIDGFKFDAGDPNFYEPDDQSYIKTTRNGHCEAWARVGLSYPLNEYRACWKLAGQPLMQRLRDKNHTWVDNGMDALIPDGLAQSLIGYAYTCPDLIGGGDYMNFTEQSDRLDPELFVRYSQCSALFPMMQFSAAPWRVLDEEHNKLCVEAANLHYRFGEEIMDLARHSSVTGEPIIRHMAYEFPNAGMEQIIDQFMLGSTVLVAPVVVKGGRSRSVSFPAGTWHGDDGSVVVGPCVKEIEVPLSRLPWYRKQ